MSNNVLFVFEGDSTEDRIVASLQKYFVNENTSVKCVYGAEIYQLYREIENDGDLDTFNVLKERSTKNQNLLKDYIRSDFAEIYLFFDYDGHSTLANDEKLNKLLNFFNEETAKGKLYISYPMVESLKHICQFENFKDLTVKCKDKVGYKNMVHHSCLQNLRNFNKYDSKTWKLLIRAHLVKMNFVVNGANAFPQELVTQLIIFSKQLEKYINIDSTVAVLSAFPVFLHDYYGNEGIRKRIA